MQAVDLVIVDDDQLTLDIIAWNLRKSPASFQMYTKPLEAFEYLKNAMPSLLIVDNYMPLMDGMELLAALDKAGQIEASSIYLCSAAKPPSQHIDRLARWGVATLDKSVVSNRALLLELIEEARKKAAPASAVMLSR